MLWFFHWTVRTSGGFNPPGEEDYYNFLVRGWRSGHLHMSKVPSPEMLKLSDPYDPAQNGPHRLADASFYEGRYYLYFGAVPAALVMWPYYLVTGRELGTTTTIYLFAVVGFLAAAGLYLRIRREFFPLSGAWTAPLGVGVLAFGSHVLALQRRPLVWELPIVTAYAFTMLGLLFFSFLIRRPALRYAVGAGLCIGLAMAARPTYLFAALALLPPLWWLWRQNEARAVFFSLIAALLVGPSAALAHNYARFGNALEFGQNYQLTSIYESKAEHFRLSYLRHNIGLYYFQRPEWTPTFPYISAATRRDGPAGYLGAWNEPVGGIFFTLPFLAIAPAALCAMRRKTRREEALSVMTAGIALGFVGMAAVTCGFFLSTPRYMADFTPLLALLACIGLLLLEQCTARSRWKFAVHGALGVLGLVTVLSGVLMSFDYHHRLLRQLAPDRWQTLENFFPKIPIAPAPARSK